MSFANLKKNYKAKKMDSAGTSENKNWSVFRHLSFTSCLTQKEAIYYRFFIGELWLGQGQSSINMPASVKCAGGGASALGRIQREFFNTIYWNCWCSMLQWHMWITLLHKKRLSLDNDVNQCLNILILQMWHSSHLTYMMYSLDLTSSNDILFHSM